MSFIGWLILIGIANEEIKNAENEGNKAFTGTKNVMCTQVVGNSGNECVHTIMGINLRKNGCGCW